MSAITTHVLDTSLGRPAVGVPVTLDFIASQEWHQIGTGVTNADGRVTDLLLSAPLQVGHYRLSFEVATYFKAQSKPSFYPSVQIIFEVKEVGSHYHVPLLLSPYGYSTYRGS